MKKTEYDYSSSGLKTPFFALRILHSGHRHESGTSSQAVPGETPFFGSPFYRITDIMAFETHIPDQFY
jgi:hypothetical protein